MGRARLCVSISPFATSHFSSLFRPVRSEVADREEGGAEEEGWWEDRGVSTEERGVEEEEREDADAEVDRGVGIGVAGAAAVAGASPAVLAVADFLAGAEAAFLEAGSVRADALMVCT